MYYIQPTKNHPNETLKRLVLFSSDGHQMVLCEAHDVNGTYQGQKHTLICLIQDYYWTTVVKDVVSWVRIVQFDNTILINLFSN